MVILSPPAVTLGTAELRSVESVLINRTPDRLVVEHTDLGPHAAFVDVPERRVTVTIRRRVQEDEPSPAKPGDSVALTLTTSESAAAGRARRISASAVVTHVTHDIGPSSAIIQTIVLIAFSTDGVPDPITETLIST